MKSNPILLIVFFLFLRTVIQADSPQIIVDFHLKYSWLETIKKEVILPSQKEIVAKEQVSVLSAMDYFSETVADNIVTELRSNPSSIHEICDFIKNQNNELKPLYLGLINKIIERLEIGIFNRGEEYSNYLIVMKELRQEILSQNTTVELPFPLKGFNDFENLASKLYSVSHQEADYFFTEYADDAHIMLREMISANNLLIEKINIRYNKWCYENNFCFNPLQIFLNCENPKTKEEERLSGTYIQYFFSAGKPKYLDFYNKRFLILKNPKTGIKFEYPLKEEGNFENVDALLGESSEEKLEITTLLQAYRGRELIKEKKSTVYADIQKNKVHYLKKKICGNILILLKTSRVDKLQKVNAGGHLSGGVTYKKFIFKEYSGAFYLFPTIQTNGEEDFACIPRYNLLRNDFPYWFTWPTDYYREVSTGDEISEDSETSDSSLTDPDKDGFPPVTDACDFDVYNSNVASDNSKETTGDSNLNSREMFPGFWRNKFEIQLMPVNNYEGMVFYSESGHWIKFNKTPEGTYKAPKGFADKLVLIGNHYEVHTKNGRKYIFGESLPIQKVIERNGNYQEFFYNAKGKLEYVIDNYGRKTAFEYTDIGFVSKITNPDGTFFRYSYNEHNFLSEKTNAAGDSERYEYDSEGRIVSKTDFSGNITSYTYNDEGKLQILSEPEGKTTYYEYGLSDYGTYTRKTFSDGTSQTKYFSHSGDLLEDNYGFSTKYFYDDNHNVIKIIDASGHETNFDYDGYFNLISETDALGKTIQYTYTTDFHLIKSITDKRGNTWHLSYDNKGNLTKIADPMGKFTEYTYSDALLSSVKDSAGNITRFLYDNFGNVKEVINAAGKSMRIQSDIVGNIEKAIDFSGHSTGFAYDSLKRIIKVQDALNNTTEFSYTKLSQMSVTLNALGFRRETIYDGLGRISKIIDAKGYETVIQYNDKGKVASLNLPEGRTYRYSYDAIGRLVGITDPEGHKRSFTLNRSGDVTQIKDENGNFTYFEYDTLNRVKTVKRYDFINTFKYDENGNLILLTDSKNQQSFFEYDALNRLISFTDAAGATTKIYYDAAGNRSKIVNANGYETIFSYDSLNRLTKIKDAAGAEELFGYDDNGNIVQYTDKEGHQTEYTYDALNRIVSVKDAIGYVTKLEYDALSNVIAAENPAGERVSLSYDELSRVTELKDAAGNITSYVYNAFGDYTAVIDANRNTTKYQYLKSGKLSKIINAMGEKTEYSYDAAGNLLTIIDGENRRKEFAYDKFNRLAAMKDGMGNVTRYEYDAAGNLVKKQKADGTVISFAYDPMNRIREVTTPENKILYSYDMLGNMLTLKDSDISCKFSYDAVNRLTKLDAGVNGSISYTYDKNGNKVTMNDPQNKMTYYGYNEINQLVSIKSPYDEQVHYTYDKAGRRAFTVHPTGIIEQNIYDPAGRLLQKLAKGENGKIVQSFSYTYDNLFNRLTETNKNNEVNRFSYDKVYRLTSAEYNDGVKEQFSYDRAGNVIKKLSTAIPDPQNYTYNAANQLTRLNNTIFSYDKNGNMKEKSEQDKKELYFYDSFDRLVKSVLPDGMIAENTYCPLGKRIQQTITDPSADTPEERSQTRKYFYDGEDVLMTFDENNQPKERFLHGPGIDEPIGILTQTGRRYLLSDGLGSVTAMTDRTGQVLERYYYRAYGEQIVSHWDTDRLNSVNSRAVPGKQTEEIFNPYGFTGREYDKTGQMYYRNRQYMPSIGRFMQTDPIIEQLMLNRGYGGTSNRTVSTGTPSCSSCAKTWGNATYTKYLNGGMLYSPSLFNNYMYVAGNPVNYRDPYGLMWTPWGNINAGESEAAWAAKYYGEQYAVEGGAWNYFMGLMTSSWSDDTASSMTAATILTGAGALTYAGGAVAISELGTIGTTLGTTGVAFKDSLIRGYQSVKNLCSSSQSIWDMLPIERGRIIEMLRGMNLPSNFPVIDKYLNNVITSIKSIDLAAKTYQRMSALNSVLTRYIDSLSNFTTRVYGGMRVVTDPNTKRVLELVVPKNMTPEQQKIIESAIEYAKSVGVTIDIIKM